MTEQQARADAHSRSFSLDVAVGLASAAWFFFLSGWLGVVPGRPIVDRIDTFFSGDTVRWLEGLDGRLTVEFSLRHPLKWFTILPIGLALTKAAAPIFGRRAAVIFVGRVMNAFFGGLGVGCLFRATRLGGGLKWGIWPALVVYLLFSAMALVAVPEHFGVSSGLLSLTFLLAASIPNVRRKIQTMAAMVLVVGGMTLTNGLYPFGVGAAAFMSRWSEKRRWLMPLVVVALLVGMTTVVAIGARVAGRVRGGGSIVMKVTNLRLVKDPAAAVRYAGHGLVDPIVAPAPSLTGDPPVLTYEPVGTALYGPARAVGAISWLILLTLTTIACARDVQGRRVLGLTIPWIAFNLVFHNLWGDEFFLYSPHWSWCLGAIFLAGARKLPGWAIAALCIPVVYSQIVALMDFRHVLALLQ